jgi:hypothetical protein
MTVKLVTTAKPSYPTVLAGAMVSCLWAVYPALGQSSDSVTVDVGRCVDLESPEQRFACYEAEVEAVREARGAGRPEAAETESSDHAAGPVSAGSSGSGAPEDRAVSSGRAAGSAAAGPAAGARQGSDASTAASRGAGGRGTDAERANDEDAREIVSTIVDVRETRSNTSLVTLDNGQIWRQMQPKWYPMRPGQAVRLYPTSWGNSYRLTAEDLNSFIQVERVR